MCKKKKVKNWKQKILNGRKILDVKNQLGKISYDRKKIHGS